MSLKIKAILIRLLKGFIGGAFGTMATVAITTSANLGELKVQLAILAFAGISGGITGLILAGQKWASWK
jgi:hypothetical protein